MDREKVTWKKYDQLCKYLIKKVKDFEFENIYGIPRGGLIVAVSLSHGLSKPLITSEKQINLQTLIADDIADSGHTLEKYKDNLTVTLHYKQNSSIEPTVWAEKTKNWIIYPWETEESSKADYMEEFIEL